MSLIPQLKGGDDKWQRRKKQQRRKQLRKEKKLQKKERDKTFLKDKIPSLQKGILF